MKWKTWLYFSWLMTITLPIFHGNPPFHSKIIDPRSINGQKSGTNWLQQLQPCFLCLDMDFIYWAEHWFVKYLVLTFLAFFVSAVMCTVTAFYFVHLKIPNLIIIMKKEHFSLLIMKKSIFLSWLIDHIRAGSEEMKCASEQWKVLVFWAVNDIIDEKCFGALKSSGK